MGYGDRIIMPTPQAKPRPAGGISPEAIKQVESGGVPGLVSSAGAEGTCKWQNEPNVLLRHFLPRAVLPLQTAARGLRSSLLGARGAYGNLTGCSQTRHTFFFVLFVKHIR